MPDPNETDAQREARISEMQERAGEQPQPIYPERIIEEKTLDFRFVKRYVPATVEPGAVHRLMRILQQKVTVRHQKDGGESMFEEWRDVPEAEE
jgi:hypothetical protein